MKFSPIVPGLIAAVMLSNVAAAAEIDIGVIGSFSGPYAMYGKAFREATNLFLEQHGGKVDADTVKVFYRDDGGPAPQRVRQLAQELVVRDHVQYLAGINFTPNVMAAADVVNQAKIPLVIFNSGTSQVTRKSPYFVRSGFTQWTVTVPLARYAASQGKKTAVIAVADFAPGTDASAAFSSTFTAAGGKVLEEVRIPIDTTDFASYLQKIEDAGPDCVFIFLTQGPMSVAFVKSYIDRGLKAKGIELYATDEWTDNDLPAIGEGAIGLVSALHYGPALANPVNQAFVVALQNKSGADGLPDLMSVAAYDGMQVVFHMIEATGSIPNAEKAMASVKGFAWTSPRGPVSIDPKTREIVQNVYIRRVAKENGKLVNREFATYPAVKEPWLEAHPE